MKPNRSLEGGWAFLVLLAILTIGDATNVKWTASDKGSDPAKSAPKSQKYWDENNIERPDYAKTDAEIAVERGIAAFSSGSAVWVCVVLALLIGLVYIFTNSFYWQDITHGHKLGSKDQTSIFLPSGLTEAQKDHQRQLREARLSRFDHVAKED